MNNWVWKRETPDKTITALCKGDSCIGEYDEGGQYFVASYMAHWSEPIWTAGKQQIKCEVECYIPLMELLKPEKHAVFLGAHAAHLINSLKQEHVVLVVSEPNIGIGTNSIFINGTRYIEIPKPFTNPILEMGTRTYLPYLKDLDKNAFDNEYIRKLPDGIDIVKEFEKVDNKTSSLTKWEREEVTKQFFKKYKKAE